MQRISHPQRLEDRLGDADTRDLSVLVLFDGWVEDLERLHRSMTAQLSCDWELVAVDNPGDDAASERIATLERTVHVPLRDKVGFGAGRNLALRLATGRIACVVDTSVEITGDAWPSIDSGLSDGSVGLLGRWGVTTDDGFDFSEAPGREVDGVEGYFMAVRRADVGRIGFFDPKFRFYRNADLDFSYRVRAAGLRTIVDPTLPLVRHEHRLWENTADRDELSRANFARFRRHWF
jgi:glycosyltransferase involved in cell wall biosynthesis